MLIAIHGNSPVANGTAAAVHLLEVPAEPLGGILRAADGTRFTRVADVVADGQHVPCYTRAPAEDPTAAAVAASYEVPALQAYEAGLARLGDNPGDPEAQWWLARADTLCEMIAALTGASKEDVLARVQSTVRGGTLRAA